MEQDRMEQRVDEDVLLEDAPGTDTYKKPSSGTVAVVVLVILVLLVISVISYAIVKFPLSYKMEAARMFYCKPKKTAEGWVASQNCLLKLAKDPSVAVYAFVVADSDLPTNGIPDGMGIEIVAEGDQYTPDGTKGQVLYCENHDEPEIKGLLIVTDIEFKLADSKDPNSINTLYRTEPKIKIALTRTWLDSIKALYKPPVVKEFTKRS